MSNTRTWVLRVRYPCLDPRRCSPRPPSWDIAWLVSERMRVFADFASGTVVAPSSVQVWMASVWLVCGVAFHQHRARLDLGTPRSVRRCHAAKMPVRSLVPHTALLMVALDRKADLFAPTFHTNPTKTHFDPKKSRQTVRFAEHSHVFQERTRTCSLTMSPR